ncbi:NADH-quinone oxidoreductase subunit C [Streptomyces xinghaiensis]|uniref:NADH-quinone oxidoreductase subunit C n=1 Tax=Streptomyces xinghaiensis TaxID=1038928 RepID=UPI000BB0B796|nr:NADH-quinone oxidoreductase subunit C [Streptomyces xinghaiensis]
MTEPNRPDEADGPAEADGGTAAGQPPVGWLPGAAEELFGAGATASDAYDLLTVDVPAASWVLALEIARDALRCTYFDWLSAVDEPGTGFLVAAHLVSLPDAASGTGVRRLLVRTTVPHDAAELPTASGVYAGATWHERETHEMFGIGFTGHPGLEKLLLPENFEGHPLRKDFVLAARVAKAWPGAKEPGESGHGGPKRRQMLPPGVPDPNEWGPLKGQLPPAPTRAARGARAAGAAGRAGAAGAAAPAGAAERRPRRARSASAGSASQRAAEREGTPPDGAAAPPATGTDEPARDTGTPESGPRGSGPKDSGPGDSGRAAGKRPAGESAGRKPAPRSPDAPWLNPGPDADSGSDTDSGPDTDSGSDADSGSDSGSDSAGGDS